MLTSILLFHLIHTGYNTEASTLSNLLNKAVNLLVLIIAA